MTTTRSFAFAALIAASAVLAGCSSDRLPKNSRHYVPITPATVSAMASKGMSESSPILLRSFKKESELEVWKKNSSGQFALLKTYPMCRWSGQLGPKLKEGDRQVPEGFYSVKKHQLNPQSQYYLSFNIGYPNAYDRARGATGGAIMVHGACTSAGCMSMTDEQVADLYALMREALDGGQDTVQVQSYPFRMTADNLAKYRADDNMAFWRNLKEGNDYFEVAGKEPSVQVCKNKYVFNSTDGACETGSATPDWSRMVASKHRQDMTKVATLIRSGEPAVKRVYGDGDMHDSFNGRVSSRNGKISQQHMLAYGAKEVFADPAKVAKADAQIMALIGQPAPQVVPSAAPLPAAVTEVPAAAAPVDPVPVAATTPAVTTTTEPQALPEPVVIPTESAAPLDLTGATPRGNGLSRLLFGGQPTLPDGAQGFAAAE
jgi:murein L,D-transpeptidase YafK